MFSPWDPAELKYFFYISVKTQVARPCQTPLMNKSMQRI